MDELIKINYDSDRPTILGRDLHELLEVKTAYKDWFPRMCEYGFTEGVDFNPLKIERVQMEGTRYVTREMQDHQLTIDMAKEICMLQRTEKGKQARQYFIQIEADWNSPERVLERARMIEDRKRLSIRNELKTHNKALADAAHDAGVIESRDYAIFQNRGYQGLYGGMGRKEIHQHKGLKKSQDILDHMGSTELAANLFRATQTEEKLRKEQIRGKEQANQTHYEVGAKVRKTMQEISGTLPELLPGNTSGLPMFKYLRSYNKETFDKIKEYSLIHTNIDSFLNSALLRRKKNFPKHYTLKSILESSVFKKKYTEIYLLDKDKLDINVLEKYLRDLLKEKDILKNNPELKRLIRIYDWLKYKENLA